MRKSIAEKSPFSKLIQIGVVVRDMDKAIEHLTSLGIGPFQPKIIPPNTKEWFHGEPLNAKLDIKSTMLGDIELELIQPIEGDSPHKEFLDSKGEGIQHIAFAVDNLDKEVDQLTKKGASVLFGGKMPRGGFAYLDLDVGGIIAELLQT
jgi:methylmalonyl-CoA/ethylmalonyl-CoA epimerase